MRVILASNRGMVSLPRENVCDMEENIFKFVLNLWFILLKWEVEQRGKSNFI